MIHYIFTLRWCSLSEDLWLNSTGWRTFCQHTALWRQAGCLKIQEQFHRIHQTFYMMLESWIYAWHQNLEDYASSVNMVFLAWSSSRILTKYHPIIAEDSMLDREFVHSGSTCCYTVFWENECRELVISFHCNNLVFQFVSWQFMKFNVNVTVKVK